MIGWRAQYTNADWRSRSIIMRVKRRKNAKRLERKMLWPKHHPIERLKDNLD